MATDDAAESAAECTQTAEAYVTVQQAAVRLGIAERTVYARVAAGRLRTRQNGRRMLVQISHANAAKDADSQVPAIVGSFAQVHALHALHAEERLAWDDERRRLLGVIEALTAEMTQRMRAR